MAKDGRSLMDWMASGFPTIAKVSAGCETPVAINILLPTPLAINREEVFITAEISIDFPAIA